MCEQMIPKVPLETLNLATTGSQPRGWTCLHFLCDGSDKSFERAWLVDYLLRHKAELEAKCSQGNTPLMLAAATGLDDHVGVLRVYGADLSQLLV